MVTGRRVSFLVKEINVTIFWFFLALPHVIRIIVSSDKEVKKKDFFEMKSYYHERFYFTYGSKLN